MTTALDTAIASAPWLAAARQSLVALRARGAHALLLHGPAGTGKWNAAIAYAGDPAVRAQSGRRAGLRSMRFVPPDGRWKPPGHSGHRARRAGPKASGRWRRRWRRRRPAAAEPAAKTKPSREIKIDQVRELASLSGLTAHRGGARVVVLGPAEALNLPAANALLKGLEEPPPGMVFVLVSDQVDRCLPTILSRCALVRVAVPPRDTALAWLQAQGVGEDAALRLIEAGGAPLAALRGDEDALPADMRATLLALLRRGAALDPAEVAGDVPRTVTIGPAVALFQRWGWDYFSYRTGGGLRYHPQDEASFAALARHWSLSAAGAWMDGLRRLRAVAEHPLNARSAVEAVLLDYIESIRKS